ncbi:TPA: PilI type IV pilus biogenesis protein [Salmonella enterica]|nr:PilI type IV pilus biogenesis protein [Salmonella enterica]HEA0268682.1 PilI type IV pilus biogenesis protein [Salmonella enterica]HEA0295523.1 PilI type IV pilus biogenesis protein [Salmonella enterica]HEA0304631.1 PilI type IV pilus biogenesis protein [Salmonella enterica]HEA0336836.1 PilI type IV pilus biogenesis protein [Salmonella enterica]
MDISASVPLKVLVIDNTCGKHIHDLLPEDDPLTAAREFCTPCTCPDSSPRPSAPLRRCLATSLRKTPVTLTSGTAFTATGY